jgi:hypothetical protein
MSAVFEHLHALLDEAKAEIAKLIHHGDADVKAAAEAANAKLDAVKSAVESDVPALDHEAVADAEHVALDAETEGLKPAEAAAVADAAKLGAEAVHDAETAVETKPADAAPAATDTPAA